MNAAGAIRLTQQAEDFLIALATELEIPPSRYQQATESYESLGKWLHREGSLVKRFNPTVYVQGSFRLGTVIRPVNDEEDYDVDSVCELRALTKPQLTQFQLKQLVGREIIAYNSSMGMTKPVREGRRCWVLDYADGAQFHMDTVPALQNSQDTKLLLETNGFDASFATTAISITDNEHYAYRSLSSDWPRSNPKGYSEWFKSRMVVIFERRRRELAESIRERVEAIPDYKIITPLQQAIMILKRHRDVAFNGREKIKPISVILTTLSGHSYNGEESIGTALISILAKMDTFVHYENGIYVIPNPTDPLENFADKWAEFPERAQAFFDWLRAARQDFYQAAALTNQQAIAEAVAPRIGRRVADRARVRAATPRPLAPSLLRPTTVAPAAAVVPSFPPTRRTPSEPDGFGFA